MPQRYVNIFDDVLETLNAEVNPYVKELINAEQEGLPALYGSKLKNMQGQWNEKFANFSENNSKKPLILEIGSHKGKTIRELAQDFPNKNFIGLDITFKRVAYTARRAKEDQLNNIISVLGNGNQIDAIFSENELDGVIIFFPDPWSKKAGQTKHRLISKSFCEMIRQLIKPNGFIWFKTDDENYFTEGSSYISEAGFQIATNKPEISQGTYETTFERKFKLMGLPTFEKVWINYKQN